MLNCKTERNNFKGEFCTHWTDEDLPIHDPLLEDRLQEELLEGVRHQPAQRGVQHGDIPHKHNKGTASATMNRMAVVLRIQDGEQLSYPILCAGPAKRV